MALKLVTFDITDTLLSLKVPVGHHYAKIGALYGIDASPEKLTENFKSSFKKLSLDYPNFGEGNIGWQEWWKKLVFRTFQSSLSEQPLSQNTANKISDKMIEDFKTDECWKLADGTEKLLKKLVSKNLTLGVISNYDPRLIEILRNLRINTYFKFVLTSYECKCEKPSYKIFQNAENIMPGVKKSEILHVGDNPEMDFMGAKKAGWKALLVTKNADFIVTNHCEIKRDSIVSDIKEIYPTLEKKGLI